MLYLAVIPPLPPRKLPRTDTILSTNCFCFFSYTVILNKSLTVLSFDAPPGSLTLETPSWADPLGFLVTELSKPHLQIIFHFLCIHGCSLWHWPIVTWLATSKGKHIAFALFLKRTSPGVQAKRFFRNNKIMKLSLPVSPLWAWAADQKCLWNQSERMSLVTHTFY